MKKQAEQLIKDFVTGFLAGDWEQFKHFTDSSLPLYERKDNFNKKRGEK